MSQATLSADHGKVRERVHRLSEVLNSHAGGLELQSISSTGSVVVQFTGMCTGCPLRPVSFAGLVRPTLEALPGVTSVEAAGGRLSREAEARLTAALARTGSQCLRTAIVGEGDPAGVSQ